ncbi:MAG: transglutaminase family protein [Tepidiformaceae bacterium]
MRLDLVYRTQYVYVPAVRGGVTALRLRPTPGAGLSVNGSRLIVSPGSVATTYSDGWGTAVDVIETRGTHQDATFELAAQVETHPDQRDLVLSPYEAHVYARDSARVRIGAVAALGWQQKSDGTRWEALEAAMCWLPERLRFRVGVTDAETELEDVIERGEGVCQDFAHVFLAWLRRDGWCARYVSGYMFTSREDAEQIEADAMHAWVEVYRPGEGWIGLDATAGELADGRYVAVGRGRDYDDVRPIRGVFQGRTSQSQTAHLSMMRIPEQ